MISMSSSVIEFGFKNWEKINDVKNSYAKKNLPGEVPFHVNFYSNYSLPKWWLKNAA